MLYDNRKYRRLVIESVIKDARKEKDGYSCDEDELEFDGPAKGSDAAYGKLDELSERKTKNFVKRIFEELYGAYVRSMHNPSKAADIIRDAVGRAQDIAGDLNAELRNELEDSGANEVFYRGSKNPQTVLDLAEKLKEVNPIYKQIGNMVERHVMRGLNSEEMQTGRNKKKFISAKRRAIQGQRVSQPKVSDDAWKIDDREVEYNKGLH